MLVHRRAGSLFYRQVKVFALLLCSFSLPDSLHSPRTLGEHFQPVRNFPPKHFSELKSLLIFPTENTISVQNDFSLHE